MLAPYLRDPFEFYGGNLKLSEVDRVRHTKDHLYRSQDAKIERLENQIFFLENENNSLSTEAEGYRKKIAEID